MYLPSQVETLPYRSTSDIHVHWIEALLMTSYVQPHQTKKSTDRNGNQYQSQCLVVSTTSEPMFVDEWVSKNKLVPNELDSTPMFGGWPVNKGMVWIQFIAN